MVTCDTCFWGRQLSREIRFSMGQENKEIVNILERGRICLDDFCFCEKLGFIESRIMKRDCDYWIKKNCSC
jgi:hypothetical protein